MNGSNQMTAGNKKCLRDDCQKRRTNARGSLGRFCSVDCLTSYRRDSDPTATQELKTAVESLLS